MMASTRKLLVVGGGLFGSLAAAWARKQGIEAIVFDAALPGAASPAAACLLKEAWAGKKWKHAYDAALPVLDELFGLRQVSLENEAGVPEHFHFVPPSLILDSAPRRERVSAVGDGWIEMAGERLEGWVYVAAGIWSATFCPGLTVQGKAGASFLFAGERPGRIRPIAYGQQALAFVRDPGHTYFSDGTAVPEYTEEEERRSLERAAEVGLTEPPVKRLLGYRPYVPGGPVFRQLGERTWLGTGGRKMGTVLGAHFARELVDQLQS